MISGQRLSTPDTGLTCAQSECKPRKHPKWNVLASVVFLGGLTIAVLSGEATGYVLYVLTKGGTAPNVWAARLMRWSRSLPLLSPQRRQAFLLVELGQWRYATGVPSMTEEQRQRITTICEDILARYGETSEDLSVLAGSPAAYRESSLYSVASIGVDIGRTDLAQQALKRLLRMKSLSSFTRSEVERLSSLLLKQTHSLIQSNGVEAVQGSR